MHLTTRPADADIPTLERAFAVAEEHHRGQRRKSGEPFITHPLAVATILADLGLDTTTLAAALLHDTVEDTGYTIAADPGRVRPGGGAPGRRRDQAGQGPLRRRTPEAETIRKMVVAAGRDLRVLVIKLADRLHNMRTLRYQPPHKQQRTARATQDVLVPLADRLGIRAAQAGAGGALLRRAAAGRGGDHGAAGLGSGRRAGPRWRPRWPGSWRRSCGPAGSRRPSERTPPPVLGVPDQPGARRQRRPAAGRGPGAGAGRRGRHAGRLLRRAGAGARALAAGAGPLQGPHRGAEVQPLPVAAHHRARPGRRAAGRADPDRGDAPGRRARHRRPAAGQLRARHRAPVRGGPQPGDGVAAPAAGLAAGGRGRRRVHPDAARRARRRPRGAGLRHRRAGGQRCPRAPPRSTWRTRWAARSGTAPSAPGSTAGWCR